MGIFKISFIFYWACLVFKVENCRYHLVSFFSPPTIWALSILSACKIRALTPNLNLQTQSLCNKLPYLWWATCTAEDEGSALSFAVPSVWTLHSMGHHWGSASIKYCQSYCQSQRAEKRRRRKEWTLQEKVRWLIWIYLSVFQFPSSLPDFRQNKPNLVWPQLCGAAHPPWNANKPFLNDRISFSFILFQMQWP